MHNTHSSEHEARESVEPSRIRAIALRMEPDDQQQLLNLTRKTWSNGEDIVIDTRYKGKPENASYAATVAEYTLEPLSATSIDKKLSSDRQQRVRNWVQFFGTVTCHETVLRYFSKPSIEAQPSILALSRVAAHDHKKFMSLVAIQGIQHRLIVQNDEFYIVSRIAKIVRARSNRSQPPEAQAAILPVHFTQPTILS